MPFDAPFQLGPFHVGPDGGLSLAGPDRLPRFTIQWRGCRVEVGLGAGPVDSGLGELSLRAMVGRVPSTARIAADPAAPQRDAVFAALRSLPATLPEGWRTDLLADHRVALLTATKVAMPTTVTSLLTDVTQFLLALGPYLDLLEELGVEAPAASDPAPGAPKGAPGVPKGAPGVPKGAPGIVNTWPG
jgi:hypothetical protein